MSLNLAIGENTVGKYLIYIDIKRFNKLTQSCFWLNFLLTTVTVIIFTFSSQVFSTFFNEPILVDLIIILSIDFFVNQIAVVPNSILEKKLVF